MLLVLRPIIAAVPSICLCERSIFVKHILTLLSHYDLLRYGVGLTDTFALFISIYTGECLWSQLLAPLGAMHLQVTLPRISTFALKTTEGIGATIIFWDYKS